MRIAVIPARGGSKRIPRKNIREFAGKPIIAWPIETALQSGLFDRVIVSTDDKEIRAVAEKFGAEVPFLRPQELSDDHTTTNAVIVHAIETLASPEMPISHICCLYATAPFIQKTHLNEGYSKLITSKKDFSFTVSSFPSAIQRALRITENGSLSPMWGKNTLTRTQDLEEAYYDAGQFYWGRTEAFLKNTSVHSSASVPIIIPRVLAHDIDTMEDWELAELIFNTLNKHN